MRGWIGGCVLGALFLAQGAFASEEKPVLGRGARAGACSTKEACVIGVGAIAVVGAIAEVIAGSGTGSNSHFSH